MHRFRGKDGMKTSDYSIRFRRAKLDKVGGFFCCFLLNVVGVDRKKCHKYITSKWAHMLCHEWENIIVNRIRSVIQAHNLNSS